MGFPNSVPDEMLTCLILWPDGTLGYAQEKQVVRLLNQLCKEYGYGRVPQLAAAIEDIWRRGSEGIGHHEAVKKEHFERMKWLEKELEKED